MQRDLLPIIEGSVVTTKHGNVNTDHILFICSGAFHSCKPSDMLAELQGRLPVRVELKGLTCALPSNASASMRLIWLIELAHSSRCKPVNAAPPHVSVDETDVPDNTLRQMVCSTVQRDSPENFSHASCSILRQTCRMPLV